MTETFVKISEIIFPRVASLVITNYFTQDTKCLFRFGLNLKTMELKDFIAKTLSDISIGINNGNDLIQQHNYSFVGDNAGIKIDFDISVSYDEKDKTDGEAKITVISLLSGSLKKGNEVTNSNFSRIKFAVNMNFSTTKVKAQ